MRGKLLAATIIYKIAQAIGEAALGQAVVMEVEKQVGSRCIDRTDLRISWIVNAS